MVLGLASAFRSLRHLGQQAPNPQSGSALENNYKNFSQCPVLIISPPSTCLFLLCSDLNGNCGSWTNSDDTPKNKGGHLSGASRNPLCHGGPNGRGGASKSSGENLSPSQKPRHVKRNGVRPVPAGYPVRIPISDGLAAIAAITDSDTLADTGIVVEAINDLVTSVAACSGDAMAHNYASVQNEMAANHAKTALSRAIEEAAHSEMDRTVQATLDSRAASLRAATAEKVAFIAKLDNQPTEMAHRNATAVLELEAAQITVEKAATSATLDAQTLALKVEEQRLRNATLASSLAISEANRLKAHEEQQFAAASHNLRLAELEQKVANIRAITAKTEAEHSSLYAESQTKVCKAAGDLILAQHQLTIIQAQAALGFTPPQPSIELVDTVLYFRRYAKDRSWMEYAFGKPHIVANGYPHISGKKLGYTKGFDINATLKKACNAEFFHNLILTTGSGKPYDNLMSLAGNTARVVQGFFYWGTGMLQFAADREYLFREGFEMYREVTVDAVLLDTIMRERAGHLIVADICSFLNAVYMPVNPQLPLDVLEDTISVAAQLIGYMQTRQALTVGRSAQKKQSAISLILQKHPP